MGLATSKLDDTHGTTTITNFMAPLASYYGEVGLDVVELPRPRSIVAKQAPESNHEVIRSGAKEV